MRKLILITIALTLIAGPGWSQQPIKRPIPHPRDNNHPAVIIPQEVTVSNPDGQIAGHGYVDLGLPSGLKWATCNVGASSPSDYGSYFAWGETTTKSSYDESNSLTFEKSISELRSEGIIGSDGNLTPSHDAARANWGSSWRMPTEAECQELIDRCTWTWSKQCGEIGYKVTGRNGKSIFLPCAGRRDGTSLRHAGEFGRYWSSAPYEEYSYYAYNLGFCSGNHNVGWNDRSNGFSVRPVTE